MNSQTPAERSRPSLAPERRFAWLWRVLIAVCIVYGAWCVLLFTMQGKLMFPREFAPKPGEAMPFGPVEVMRRALPSGGEAIAWFAPVNGASEQRPAPVVVYYHGNAEIIDQQESVVRMYHRLGVSVLLIEMRGYGRSAGEPSQAAFREDSLAFFDEMLTRADVDRGRIVIHGRSLGGGAAADLAAAHPPKAMILEATFTSAASMAWRYLAPPFLVTSPFRTERVVRTLDAPLLVMHGIHDEVVSVSHGRALRAMAKRAQLREFDCMHNDLFARGFGDEYWDTIATFLRSNGIIAPLGRD